MKAIKASDAGIENDSGIICYLSLHEAILFKTMARLVIGDSATSVRGMAREMASKLSGADVWINGTNPLAGELKPVANSLAVLQENVNVNNS